MRAYGKNLWKIMKWQFDDALHTGMAMPQSGRSRGKRRRRYLRPFKKSMRAELKERLRKEILAIA